MILTNTAYPFALVGIALVLLLLIFKLTTAAGTIKSLIFYSNAVAVNHPIFFPPNETNILTVFIAWLNLDLGMEIVSWMEWMCMLKHGYSLSFLCMYGA